MPKCRECDVDLVSEVNWYKSKERINDKVCRECYLRLNKVYKAKYREKNKALGESVFDGTLKRCSGCKEEKPRSRGFWATAPSTPDGLGNYCLSCQRVRRVASIYGINQEDKELLWEKQEHKCAICKTPVTSNGDANVDHDHELGWVKGESSKLYTQEQKRLSVNGLLCMHCNRTLGSIASTGLSPETWAANALAYEQNPPAKGVLWETR